VLQLQRLGEIDETRALALLEPTVGADAGERLPERRPEQRAERLPERPPAPAEPARLPAARNGPRS
jgi:hypothetical protein